MGEGGWVKGDGIAARHLSPVTFLLFVYRLQHLGEYLYGVFLAE